MKISQILQPQVLMNLSPQISSEVGLLLTQSFSGGHYEDAPAVNEIRGRGT